MELYNDRTPKTRKAYVCDLCGDIIPKGVVYNRQSGKYDGEFFDRKLHAHCANMIDRYCSENQEHEFTDSVIIDWITDLYCYGCEARDSCEIITLRCGIIVSDFLRG